MVLMGMLGTIEVVLVDVVVRRYDRDKSPGFTTMSARSKEDQTQDDLAGRWMGV